MASISVYAYALCKLKAFFIFARNFLSYTHNLKTGGCSQTPPIPLLPLNPSLCDHPYDLVVRMALTYHIIFEYAHYNIKL